MKIVITEKTTEIEADARELRESNTLAGNFIGILNRCFQNSEPLMIAMMKREKMRIVPSEAICSIK